MPTLSGQRILVGVTGGIAAYKSPELVRLLMEQGATVRVAMTPSATKFISPLTMQAVSQQPIHTSLLDTEAENGMGHIELARWADQIIIAPATANFIAKLAVGLADDLLSAICLASEIPIAIAPAMNQLMWHNLATQKNVAILIERGVSVLGPDSGIQACGDIGLGRMVEPVLLLDWFHNQPLSDLLADTRVLITAGPTWEAVDPVRALTNHSSGKMGYAIADSALRAGADVTLISGPTNLSPPGVAELHSVTTAEEMFRNVENIIADIDIFIGVAAVADYRPKTVRSEKLKKSDTSIQIELVPNPDILSSVTSRSSPPFTIGFAAETTDLVQNARKKLREKKADLMVANTIGQGGAPFGKEFNSLILIDHRHEIDLGSGTKQLLADRLIMEIAPRYYATNSSPHS